MRSDTAGPPEEAAVGASAGGRRRLLSLLVIVFLVGAPAAVLRVLCVGNACDRPEDAAANVPFCSLPDDMRRRIQAGYREGRSPDVVAVTELVAVQGFPGYAAGGAAWPSLAGSGSSVPLVFWGKGIAPGVSLEAARLDQVAPTVARVVDLRRPHPEVRSGTVLEEALASGRARVVVLVAWKGVSAADLQARPDRWPYLQSLLDEGAGTLEADVGALPLDPAAALTTIGTGGLPHQHGITGGFVRNDEGRLTRAWGRGAPISVIAALGDDLDERLGQRPLIGVAGTEPFDRGLIGGNWYIDVDRDVLRTGLPPEDVARAAVKVLRSGFGRDGVPDLLAVAASGDLRALDRSLRKVVDAARRVSQDNVTVVVTATGSAASDPTLTMAADDVAESVEAAVGTSRPVVEAVVPGGVFLDQRTIARESVNEDEVIQALFDLTHDGETVAADVFPGLAISFARYC